MAARVIPRFISPALQQTTLLVHCMLREWLAMPQGLEQFVLAAIMESKYERPRELKRHCAVLRAVLHEAEGKLRLLLPESFFLTMMTPEFAVKLFEDLRVEGLLTRRQATQAEDYALAIVDKDGQWKKGAPDGHLSHTQRPRLSRGECEHQGIQ